MCVFQSEQKYKIHQNKKNPLIVYLILSQSGTAELSPDESCSAVLPPPCIQTG